MTLYEELGLSFSASPEEIRKAHRTLSRLLHPDQQTEESLRQAAELQMRRVNIIVDVLLDPQQRRRYDDSLRVTPPLISPPFPLAPRPVPRAPLSFLDLLGIILAAVLVTLLMVWVLGGEFIHLRGLGSEWNASADTVEAGTREELARSSPTTVQPAPMRDTSRPEQATEPPAMEPPVIHTVGLPAPIEPEPQHKPMPAILVFKPDTPALSSNAYPASSMILPALSVPEITVSPDKVTPPALSFTGLWLLPSSGRKAGSAGAMRQAPQYIQINILRGQNDTVFGEYSARYEAPDRPISPEVAFTFEGPIGGKEASFGWNATDGSRGGVELKLLNPRSMRVTWHVNQFGTSIGIAGGAAVVIRKAD
jgi:hypothetical protein